MLLSPVETCGNGTYRNRIPQITRPQCQSANLIHWIFAPISQVPIANREVHEVRCFRTHPPGTAGAGPAAPPADGNAEEQPSDPESPNVFTPYNPSPAAAPWREVDVQALSAAAAAATRDRETERGGRGDGPPSAAELDIPASGARAGWSLSEEAEAEFWRGALGQDMPSSGSAAAQQRGHPGSCREEGWTLDQPEAHAGGDGSGDGDGGGGGGGDGTAGEWACTACTFLNEDRGNSLCAMCGTRIPAEERPPDGTYRDTLIDDGGHGRGPRARGATALSTASALAAATEAARCRLLEQTGGGVSTSGGGSGGRVTGGDDPESRRGEGVASMSDAAAGSAIGALGAGMISVLTPGSRPSRVLASMMQGALVGGVAGAALGAGYRQDSGGRRDESGRRVGDGDGDGNGDGNSGRDILGLNPLGPPSADYPRQRLGESGGSSVVERRSYRLTSAFGDPRDHGRVGEGLDVMMLSEHLRVMGMSEEERREVISELITPLGLDGRRARAWGGGGQWQAVDVVASGEGSNRPASAASLSALPEEVLTVTSLSRLPEDGRQCCICLENFGTRGSVTRLPCLHLYHAACIRNWFQTSDTCPQCKHRVD